MFSRIRVALWLAVLLTLITSITVFAKGAFSFIAITGANLKEELRVTDPELTADFFTFADFYVNKAKQPADPGVGYEITRYYVDGTREIAFDRLHYYPDTGFVFYDGIVNGSSEYDGKWYTAKPEIKAVFENALSIVPIAKSQPILSNDQVESGASIDSDQSAINIAQPQFFVATVITAGLAIILLFALRRRKGLPLNNSNLSTQWRYLCFPDSESQLLLLCCSRLPLPSRSLPEAGQSLHWMNCQPALWQVSR